MERTRPPAGDEIAYVVYFLELGEPTAAEAAPPPPAAYQLEPVIDPDVDLFRRLYDGVGSAYLWTDLHEEPAEELESFVRNPAVELYLLTDDLGAEAGFFQLDRRGAAAAEGVVEIAYFGLLPDHCGRGIGRWMIREAIRLARRGGARRVDVNTCSLDHPAALGLYQGAGFRIVRTESRTRVRGSGGWTESQDRR